MDNMAMGECEDKQRKPCNTETNCRHSKEGYGRLPLGDVYTCHECFKRTSKFGKAHSKTFFHKFAQ